MIGGIASHNAASNNAARGFDNLREGPSPSSPMPQSPIGLPEAIIEAIDRARIERLASAVSALSRLADTAPSTTTWAALAPITGASADELLRRVSDASRGGYR